MVIPLADRTINLTRDANVILSRIIHFSDGRVGDFLAVADKIDIDFGGSQDGVEYEFWGNRTQMNGTNMQAIPNNRDFVRIDGVSRPYMLPAMGEGGCIWRRGKQYGSYAD